LGVVSTEGDDEAETLVVLAAELDDGEAECGAIAFHRNFVVATDDRKAINVFGRLTPPLTVARTTQLLQRWEREKGTTRAAMHAALRDIRERARFEPPPADPLFEWWMERAA
jgi:predicted nucleic acid-binding protein